MTNTTPAAAPFRTVKDVESARVALAHAVKYETAANAHYALNEFDKAERAQEKRNVCVDLLVDFGIDRRLAFSAIETLTTQARTLVDDLLATAR